MNESLKAILLFFLLLPCIAHSKDVWIGMASDSEGNKYKWTVSESVFSETPSWFEEDSLPIKRIEFIETGREYLKKKYGYKDDLPIIGFYIQIADPTRTIDLLKNKWFISIKYGGEAFSETENSVKILMDGTIVMPEITKREPVRSLNSDSLRESP